MKPSERMNEIYKERRHQEDAILAAFGAIKDYLDEEYEKEENARRLLLKGHVVIKD